MTSPEQRTAVRLVVVLLVVSIALSVLATVAGLAGHAVPLRANQILILLVAIGYGWVIRRLRNGSATAYRRVRIVSVAGFVAAAGQLVLGGHPAWLRTVEAVQLAVLAALIVAVNRPIVRAAFPAVPDERPHNRRAALALAVLAPLCAEVSLGTVPLRMAWAWLIFAPIYAAGTLALREILRRTGGGYGNLLLLGVAYGLVEEGLVLQSLTSPHLYGAAGWSPRLLGVNTAYTELNLVYHAVFSVAVPVIVVEYLFSRHGTAPYLRRGGVIAAGVIAVLGALLLRMSVPPSEDPGYTMPLTAGVVIALLAAAVTLLALRVPLHPARRRAAPPIPLIAVAAAVAAFGFLALIWPFGGAEQPLFTHGTWSLLPMAAGALIVAGLLYAAWTVAWTTRDLAAAAIGALLGHTLFGLVGNAQTLTDRLFLGGVAGLTALFGAAVLRRPPGRTNAQLIDA
ncbi:hypothetical protein ACFY2R_29370 [Micromonospora olivasterospora]|uniref:hypothetical protein n=1 Tax=Micromonospora olivasterospora TaxID=1880 RepID=UPI0011A05D60|nr:hypothetical protein [Micromonospora olivasterospora]